MNDTLKIYKEADCDLDLIKSKTVAILGYGAQGHAHALNLKDSGARVVIGLRDGSPSHDKVVAAGFEIMSVADAVRAADIVMMLIPDEVQPAVYARDVAPNIKAGAALGFAHGLNIHFGYIDPRDDIDVFMVAPKGAGYGVRSEYVAGRGVPCLMGVARDASGHAKDIALSYACAIGGGRSGIIETTFKDECETDLFGEQAVLCGGIAALVRAGFETLVEGGYAPELAYFECVHETKLIVDLLYERGLAGMQTAISNTAEYGGYVSGARVIDDRTKAEMQKILTEIQSGDFARKWMGGNAEGVAALPTLRADHAKHPMEDAGAFVRDLVFGDK